MSGNEKFETTPEGEEESVSENDVNPKCKKRKKKNPNLFREVEVSIQFDLTKLDATQKKFLWSLTGAMGVLGIGFDTGSNGQVLDWEWDWSLSGPMKVLFREWVDEDPKNRYTRKPCSAADLKARSDAIEAIETMVNQIETKEKS